MIIILGKDIMFRKLIAVLLAFIIFIPIGAQATGETFPFTLSDDKLYVGDNNQFLSLVMSRSRV